jgi:hypothetical protein
VPCGEGSIKERAKPFIGIETRNVGLKRTSPSPPQESDMAKQSDVRSWPSSVRLRERLQEMVHAPLVDPRALAEIVDGLRDLQGLNLPILSAGHLLDELESLTGRFRIAGVETDPEHVAKLMPAYYFPIASYDNLIEKLSELVQGSRSPLEKISASRPMHEILNSLLFRPIDEREQLIQQLGRERLDCSHGGFVDDWPLPLLLDETWLRCRRVLIRALERYGLWSREEEHKAVMEQQAHIGRSLEERLVAQTLKSADYAALRGSAFGSQNARIRRRLPLMLAFGNAVGRFLGRVGRLPENEMLRVADASSLFNLGICLVDVIVDHLPRAATDLLGTLGGDSLAMLAEPDGRVARAEGFIYNAPESGVVVGLALAFFQHVDSLDPTPADRTRLVRVLERALASEAASIRSDLTAEDLQQVTEDKSRLPFVTLGILSSFRASDPDIVTAHANNLGTAFSILDDLADLVKDFQARAVNSLLSADPGEDTWSDRTILESFLDNSMPEFYASNCVEALCRIERWVAERNHPELDRDLKILLHFARDWLE